MLFLLVIMVALKQADSNCVWYGECPLDKPYNCKYAGEPKPIGEPGYKILRELCPNLDTGPGSLTCCDRNQLESLKRNTYIISHFVRRCPACDVNLRNFFCEMTCGLNQSKYMTTNVRQNSVTAVNLSVSKDYVQSIIDSCRDVKFASAGQDALQVICQKEAQKCSPDDLMAVFSSNSPFPLQIRLDGGMETMSFNCNQSIKLPFGSLSACSCSDCGNSCPKECPFEPEKQFMIGRMNGYIFLSALLTIVVISTLVAYATIAYAHKQHDETTPENDERSPLVTPINDAGQNSQLFNYLLSFSCEYVGRILCRFWWISLTVGLVLCCGLSLGIRSIQLTTNPNILWSVRQSRALQEKQKFDSTFGPFYRTNQVLLTPKSQSTFIKAYTDDVFSVYTFGEALSKENLHLLSQLQSQIEQLRTSNGVSLSDVCYKPLGERCAIFSAMEYFQNDPEKLERHNGTEEQDDLVADWASHLIHCFESPLSLLDPKLNISCLPRYGGVVQPFLAVAGYNESPSNCSSLVLTYMLNSTDSRAPEWESKFLEFMATQNFSSLEVSYSAERSIEDKISEESWADLKTIVISYTLMFIYVTLSLSWRNGRRWLISGSKITLALISTFLVLLAFVASVGLFAFLRIPTTLLIFEVVPFLILAIGVDNIFILTRQCQKSELPSAEDVVAEGLQIVGPGILMASCAEITSFFLAAILSTVYAVRLFAMYASVALLLNVILQCLVFVPLLYLDSMRVQAGRPDLFCCFKCPAEPTPSNPIIENGGGGRKLKKPVRWTIVVLFLMLPIISIGVMGNLKYGLEPSVMVPTSSYLHRYLEKVGSLNTGPPVFFVVEGGDLSNTSNQNAICGGVGCRDDSLMAQLSVAEVYSNLSKIRQAPSCWLDGYFDWASTPGCCRVNKNGDFCPSSNDGCRECDIHLDDHGRPNGDEFDKYLAFYLADTPNKRCPFGGKPLYCPAVKQNASYFMGYHSTLKLSPDFIEALKKSWQIVDSAKQYLSQQFGDGNTSIYSYSVFYVFYEQYLTMERQLLTNIGVALIVVFLIGLLFTGFALRVALVILLTVWMILVDMIGMMVVWSIPMNAIAMVNLIMSIGIAVEFCAHIAMNFVRNARISCPYQRSKVALTEIGSSVFAGIGLTKLIGISVLAFAHSQLFSLMFFRMYLCLILLGITHGMVFLPALLSLIGQGEEDSSMEQESQLVSVFSDDLDDPGF